MKNDEAGEHDQRHALRQTYVSRVNRVIDYIQSNLAGDLRLVKLAEIASFSPYHFHRIFRAMVGETPNQFIRRIRVETAAMRLVASPGSSITHIACRCGYSSSSAFAREFREAFGMSATRFRNGGHRTWRLIHQPVGQGNPKHDKAPEQLSAHATLKPNANKSKNPMRFSVELRQMPEMYVAYVRHIGPYNQISAAFERLMKWARPRELVDARKTVKLAVYHDSPDITEESRLRSDACIIVPHGTQPEADVGVQNIPGGKFAVAHVEIDPDQFGEAWDRLMGEWLPESGYQPDDRMCYEIYLNDPRKHPEGKFIVDICEPVRPL